MTIYILWPRVFLVLGQMPRERKRLAVHNRPKRIEIKTRLFVECTKETKRERKEKKKKVEWVIRSLAGGI